MKINTNTFLIEKESKEYSDLETIFVKVADNNKIHEVKEAEIERAELPAEITFISKGDDSILNSGEKISSVTLDADETTLVDSVLKDIAKANKISEVESVLIKMSKDDGMIFYRIAKEDKEKKKTEKKPGKDSQRAMDITMGKTSK